ncbi:MAG: DUF1214 domain-containing protein [Myxococcales bacterium]
MSNDEVRDRVLSGEAWSEFCRALEAAGQKVLDTRVGNDELDRVEGYRLLTRFLRYGLEGFLEYADPLTPELHCATHETIKIIMENPDSLYLGARIDGNHCYRIWGTLGTASWMSFNIHAGAFGGGGRGTVAVLDAKDLEVESDRSFELFLGGPEREGNWIPMPPDASSVVMRQNLADRTKEVPCELQIERIDAKGPPAPLTAERVDLALKMTAGFMSGITEMALSWSSFLEQYPNSFADSIPPAAEIFRDPNILFHVAWFDLANDEALVIDVVPPKCDYWMFVLHNRWLESLDYRYHRISLNDSSAVLESDGSLRVVVAHRDPGHLNWLDTAGHLQGTLGVRWVGADVADVVPSAKRVNIKDVTSIS